MPQYSQNYKLTQITCPNGLIDENPCSNSHSVGCELFLGSGSFASLLAEKYHVLRAIMKDAMRRENKNQNAARLC